MKHLFFKITNILALTFATFLLLIALYSGKQLPELLSNQTHVDYQEIENTLQEEKVEKERKENPDVQDPEIVKFLKQYDLGDNNYEVLEYMTKNYDVEQREQFWREMNLVMLKQQENEQATPETALDKFDVLNTCSDLFAEKTRKQATDDIWQKAEVTGYGLALFFALFMFMLFMTIPVLIQIEKNTRIHPKN